LSLNNIPYPCILFGLLKVIQWNGNETFSKRKKSSGPLL
jgi:hypothetical protein